MKKILGLSLIMSAYVFAADVSIDLNEKFKDLENRMKQLETENTKLGEIVNSYAELNKKAMKSELSKVEDRIDGLETSVLLNKINLGLGFQTQMNNYKGKNGDDSHFYTPNSWTSKIMLNLDSKIDENIKFTGRLSMSKYWSSTSGNSNNYDYAQGKQPSDSTLYVERAYVDWNLNRENLIPVTLTIGRQPSSDGPSKQYGNNTVRKSTYSALAFDGNADGIVSTINLEKLTKNENNALRFAYGKGFQNSNTLQTSPYITTYNGIPDTTFYGVFYDMSIPNVKGSLIQLGTVKADNMNAMGTNIGNAILYGAMVEFTNLADSGVDLFAHMGLSKASPNGNIAYNGVTPMGGMLSNTGDTTRKSGYAYWVGTRYTIPYENWGKIGFEYNHGSQNWINFTQGSEDSTNKLATRGDAYEIYYIKPINRYAYLKFGYLDIKYKYMGSGMPISSPDEVGSSAALKRLQNTYMSFNLLY